MGGAECSSGWGKLNQGQPYAVLALDVGRALSTVRLTKFEGILFWAVQEHSWSQATRRKGGKGNRWPDPIPFTLGHAELARQVLGEDAEPVEVEGLRVKLTKARTTLLRDGMLVETMEGVLIETNVDKWQRFEKKFRPYGLAGRADSACPTRHGERAPIGTVGVPNEARRRAPIGTVTREERAQKDPTGLDKDNTPPLVPPGGEVCLGGRLTVETATGEVAAIVPAHAIDPAELTRICDLAESLFPMAGFDLQAQRFSALYPPAWIERALVEAAARGKRITWPYVRAILQRWAAEGGPPAPQPPGSPPSPSAASRRQKAVLDGIAQLYGPGGALHGQD
jgi:hypothetical protein